MIRQPDTNGRLLYLYEIAIHGWIFIACVMKFSVSPFPGEVTGTIATYKRLELVLLVRFQSPGSHSEAPPVVSPALDILRQEINEF